jgi:hypothetical protein
MSSRLFKRYTSYRDSLVDSLGKIPSHWDVRKLKRVAAFSYGDSLTSDGRADGDVDVLFHSDQCIS